MVYDRAFDFDLAGGEIALEVLHVGGGIPQTPLHERKQFEGLRAGGFIGECELRHFRMLAERHKEKGLGFQPVLFAFYHCIIHAMAALVRIKRGLGWLPTGIPDRALVVDIEITASGIHGHPVVAVAGEPPEFGVFIETVASGRIADKREEIFVAEIIYPGPRGARLRNHVFARLVVEVSVFHVDSSMVFSAKVSYFSCITTTGAIKIALV